MEKSQELKGLETGQSPVSARPEPWFSALGIEELVKTSPSMWQTTSPLWVQMRPQRHRVVLKVKMIKWQIRSRGKALCTNGPA